MIDTDPTDEQIEMYQRRREARDKIRAEAWEEEKAYLRKRHDLRERYEKETSEDIKSLPHFEEFCRLNGLKIKEDKIKGADDERTKD